VQRYIDEISARLAKVVIENKYFEDLINVYDKLDALFYLDPPYYKTEKYYEMKFATEDHVRLRDRLGRIKGKFILSYNDCEEVRELYRNYKIEEVSRQHNLHARYDDVEKMYKELIIRNY
jgi:DNA adenine methylase